MFIKKGIQGVFSLLVGAVSLCGYPSQAFSAVWPQPPVIFEASNYDLSQADDNGHVMLLREDVILDQLNMYYYTNGVWMFSETLPGSTASFSYDIAMEPTGTAVAIYKDQASDNIFSQYFNGSTWSTPSPDPFGVSTGFQIWVAMNGPGSAVAGWADGANINSSFLTGGSTWSTVQNIASNGLSINNIFYSSNGRAAARWVDNSPAAQISAYDGATWQPPVTVTPFSDLRGIDANGIAYLIENSTGVINVYTFNTLTSVLSGAQTISTGVGNQNEQLAVAPNGTAVAIWRTSTNTSASSTFNGTSWSAPFPFTTDILTNDLSVSVDTAGNALAVWVSSTDNVTRAARLPLGGTAWSAPEIASIADESPTDNLSSALSLNGIGFFAGIIEINEGEFDVVANASLLAAPLPPPGSISGRSCTNRFATQSEHVNIITWEPSPSPLAVAYYLRRNGVLIVALPATYPREYIDRVSGNQTYVYSLTAVDAQGNESTPVIVILP